MRRHIAEVCHCVLIFRSTQSLVVLRRPTVYTLVVLCPLLVFGHREEVDVFLAMFHSDDRGHKLDQEFGQTEERRIEMIKEVDE